MYFFTLMQHEFLFGYGRVYVGNFRIVQRQLGIYSKGTAKEKEDVARILTLANPSYSTDWEEMKKANP